MILATKTGELTSNLKKLQKALFSVPATSVESERAFSTASKFITKARNRLSDKALDNFCFARCEFRNRK